MKKEILEKADKSSTLNVVSLQTCRELYDLDPPYQRGDVWPPEWKESLIQSIGYKVPIPPLHMVKKDEEGSSFIVLDGKQRLRAIFDFLDNKVEIEIENTKYKYELIVKHSKDKLHKHFSKLQGWLNSFNQHSIPTVIYPQMSWEEQITLFQNINHSKELSKEEKIIAEYPFAKLFIKYIIANILNDFYNKSRIEKLTRGKDLFWIFRLFAGICGQNLTKPNIDIMSIPDFSKKSGQPFMQDLNSKIQTYMKSQDDDYLFDNPDRVDEMFKTFNWENIKTQLLFLNKTSNILLTKHKTNLWPTLYFLLYLTDKYNKNELTDNLFKSSQTEIKLIFKKYIEWNKEKDNDLKTRRAATNDGRVFHFSKINELWENAPFDKGEKNILFTKKEKEELLKKAGYKCEICGTTENLEYDHVLPQSLSSNKIGGILCNLHNRRKSDNTIETLNETIEYIKEKTINTNS